MLSVCNQCVSEGIITISIFLPPLPPSSSSPFPPSPSSSSPSSPSSLFHTVSCDGSGSGNNTDDPMEDECPPPDCVNITLLTLDEVNVSFSLDCTPTNLTSCSYSYLLQFITPYEGDDAVIFYNETGPVSSQYIDNGSFILYPTNGDMFVPGSLLRVFIFLSNNLTFNTSDDLLVPGGKIF